MTAVVSYGVGNLFSLVCSLEKIGEDAVVCGDADTLLSADRIILPGVGAFSDAIKKLRESGLDKTIIKAAQMGKPVMGICLGMQLLFDKSFEYGEYSGLGLIKGQIVPLEKYIPSGLKVPHMGWNGLTLSGDCPLFKYAKDGDCVYFVHSYFGIECDEFTVATAEYGIPVTAAVQNKNVFGCQFHPEKSGETGLNILRAFCGLK